MIRRRNSAVEGGVVAVHRHHQLVGRGTRLRLVDEERAVHPSGDVLGQRTDVAVVEVQTERFGIEGVGDAGAGFDQPRADPGYPVHLRRMDPVEVIVCGCAEPFMNCTCSTSPAVARRVGPGTRFLPLIYL
jgi:hypothetical protein